MKEWNIFHNFKTEADILNYLEAAWEEKDVEFLQLAVADAVAGWKKYKKKKHIKTNMLNNVSGLENYANSGMKTNLFGRLEF